MISISSFSKPVPPLPFPIPPVSQKTPYLFEFPTTTDTIRPQYISPTFPLILEVLIHTMPKCKCKWEW